MFYYFLFLLLSLTTANVKRVHKYKTSEIVPVAVNTVGPYRNPNERYKFFKKVPFCGSKSERKRDKAGSIFMGDRPELSAYSLPFREQILDARQVCALKLDQNMIKSYIDMINDNYMFELFIDHQILVTGFFGKSETQDIQFSDHEHTDKNYYLFTHWNFYCEYNSHYVISCHVTTDIDRKVLLKFGQSLDVVFTYSLDWKETHVAVNDRLLYHIRKLIKAQPLEVHWLSTLNTFILVLLVTGFVALVFNVILRQDCAKQHELNDLEDPGWKQLQTDVFRAPRYIMPFCALIGTGTQLLVLIIFILVLSLVGLFYPGNRGTLMSACIFIYFFTAGVAGHVSAKLYKQLGGHRWATNAVLTACLFAIPFFLIFLFVNSFAFHFGSSNALPFSYIFFIFIAWALFTFPLTIYCAHRVKDIDAKLDVPIKNVRPVPREIPQSKWYKHAAVQVIVAGVFPFTSIYVQLHFLFMAVFGHQVYTLFGILSLSFIMLLIVTSAITIGLTYFQLQAEDWRWWWRSFLTGASTGAYIFGYAVFYYIKRSFMSGILQGVFFFGYVFAISYAFVLVLGAVGWWSTFIFLRLIYGAIKNE